MNICMSRKFGNSGYEIGEQAAVQTERKYDVILYAPMGERSGELVLCKEGSAVRGELRILGQSTKLTGTVYEGGRIKAEGELITPMRRMLYFAEGQISEQEIQMTLHAGPGTYELNGIHKKVRAEEKA